MGSYIYDFLNDSLILDTSLISRDYQGISEKRLVQELSRYRTFSIMQIPFVSYDIRDNQGKLSSTGSEFFANDLMLKRAALYMDQIVLPDPIFPFTMPPHEQSEVFSQMLGFKQDGSIDRVKLAFYANQIISLRPLVAGNYVKFYPHSYHSEPAIQIPGGYSEVGFADLLPESISKFFNQRANVSSLEKIPNGYMLCDDLFPCRGIGLSFEGDCRENVEIYNLFEQEIISMDDNTRTMLTKMVLPDTPPKVREFDNWVSQSINKSAYEYFKNTVNNVSLATSLNSSYSSTTQLESELLRKHFFSGDKSIQANTFDSVMKMELPFLQGVSSHDLMSIRQNDGEEFANFRRELESSLKELRYEKDPLIIRRKVEDIEHEIFESQVQKINTKLKNIKKVSFADLGIAAVGLSASIATSGASLLGTLAALAHGAKTYGDYREKVTENPAFFAWKLKNSAKPTSSLNADKVMPKSRTISGITVTHGDYVVTPKE
ncbi:hypothetical protein [Shewanella sp. MBTL60-112-B2]|uniref:hypothetical protein n=1 Tax=Shewanella sp. MBTL60-112-B2 TaxID=2815917 RepID=UPI001C80702B|nr:hypothetical protein [Shewanella sp. MBTL60-112-B2]GIU32893.1 hypothetical protein TUM4445_19180 [Shewanella sp. MBTL60-112-B2]